jgi:hypothetical protein
MPIKKPAHKTFAPYYYNSPFTSLLFKSDSKTFCFGPRYESSEVTGPCRLSGVDDEDSNDEWWIFYIDDCFSPSMYAVTASSFQDAHERFVEGNVGALEIDASDLSEYGINPDGTGEPNGADFVAGKWVDTTSVRYIEVKLVEARV